MQFTALFVAAFAAATVSASSLYAPIQRCASDFRYCGKDLRQTSSRGFIDRLKQEIKTDPTLSHMNIEQDDIDNLIFCNVGRWGNEDYRPVGVCSSCNSGLTRAFARCDLDA